MAIPDYQTLMLPLLKLAADGKEYRARELIEPLAKQFNLTPREREQLLPSGKQTVFSNRIHWAKTYLTQAKLLEAPKRAHFRITDRGRSALKQGLVKIDLKYLEQFEEFRQFRERRSEDEGDGVESTARAGPKLDEIPTGLTPPEQLQASARNLEEILAKDLRVKILEQDDKFFEKLVLELLMKMFPNTSGRVTGKPGDLGIDGVILQDRFGLERIYCQAKRYDSGTVSRRDVSSFCHDIGPGSGTRGFFVTLSRFSAEAKKVAADHPPHNVILIEGDQLLKLLIEYDIAVKEEYQIKVKKIDADYFSEEEE